MTESVRLLSLGKEICDARSWAADENFGPALKGDLDDEYINTAKAVEAIFLKNGWMKPLPAPDFSNKNDDNWYPACGGTEKPFVSRSGKRMLYVFQPSTGNHAYMDVDTDMILTDDEAQRYLGVY